MKGRVKGRVKRRGRARGRTRRKRRVDGNRHRHRDRRLDPARVNPRDGLVRAHRVRAVTHHQPVRDAAVIVVKRVARFDTGGRLEKTRLVRERRGRRRRRRRALRREMVRKRGAQSRGRQGRPRGVRAVVFVRVREIVIVVLVVVVVAADRVGGDSSGSGSELLTLATRVRFVTVAPRSFLTRPKTRVIQPATTARGVRERRLGLHAPTDRRSGLRVDVFFPPWKLWKLWSVGVHAARSLLLHHRGAVPRQPPRRFRSLELQTFLLALALPKEHGAFLRLPLEKGLERVDVSASHRLAMPLDFLRLARLGRLEEVEGLAELALADEAFLLASHVDQLRRPSRRFRVRGVERSLQGCAQILHLVLVAVAHVALDAVALAAERGERRVPLAFERLPARL